MNKTRIFVSFSPDDKQYGEMMTDQLRNPFSSFEIVACSRDGQGTVNWETETRENIRKAGVFLLIVGKNAAHAANVAWEIKAAREAGIPVLGVLVGKDCLDCAPEALGDAPVIIWTWDGIYNMIRSMMN